MGEAYLRRKYGLIMLPPISVTDFIEDTFELDNDFRFKSLVYDVVESIEDNIGIDNEFDYERLQYTFDSIEDSVAFDNEFDYRQLLYTFDSIEDEMGLDNEFDFKRLLYTFDSIQDEIGLDNEFDFKRLLYTFDSIQDEIGLDNEFDFRQLLYTSDSIEDEMGLDNEFDYRVEFPAVLPPTLSNVFNIGPESADITVTNTNDFYTYVYYSITDTTPDTNEPRVLLAPSSFSSGDSFTINIENNFTLEGNNNYIFYARAYDQPLNESSSVVSRAFTTDKYRFDFAPEWVTQELQVGETSIIFAYENNNDVNADIRITVRDLGGNQAMDPIVTNINAGQTLVFNSNDYNDNFTGGETYTFDATFEKADYYDSTPTTNDVTTDSPTVFYTVTFEDWDGDVLKTETVESGQDATPPSNPSRFCYTFTGWSGSYTNVTSDRTITATYTRNGPYTVNFRDYDASIISTDYVMCGDDATPPADPSRPGYTFEGWSPSFTNVTSNLEVYAQYEIIPTPTTAVPSILNVDPAETSVNFDLRNNDGSTATIYYELNDSSPDTYSVSVSAGGTVNRTITGLTGSTSYTLYAEAQASGENRSSFDSAFFTTDAPPPQTEKPTITVLGTTADSVTFEIQNEDASTATILYEIGDSTPDASSIVVSGNSSTGPITRTGFNQGTTYTIYATAQASGETKSSVDSENFTTETVTKVWSPIGPQGSYDLNYDYGNVNGCPTYAQALAQVEATYPASGQSVGTTINVTAFDLDTFTSCTQFQFQVIEE